MATQASQANTGAANPGEATKRPGFVVGAVALLHAAVFGVAATFLPWEGASSFGISAGAMALGYCVLTLAVWTRRPQAASVWRFVSVGAIVFLGVWAYLAASAGVYLARLYGGLGEGLAVATAAAFTPVVLFTLPFAFWGLAATRGASPRRGLKLGATLALLGAGAGTVEACASAGSHELALPDEEPAQLQLQLHEALRKHPTPTNEGDSAAGARVFTLEPAACAEPLHNTELASAYLTYVSGSAAEGEATTICMQSEPETLLDKVAKRLSDDEAIGPAKVDLVSAWAPLASDHPLVDGLKLRPGLDGACLEGRCLMPWQLVASDQFTKFVPVSFIADLRVGFDPKVLAESLGAADPASAEAADFVRVKTHSFWLDAKRGVHPLVRGRSPHVVVDEAQTRAAARAAERYILSAQEKDGRFRYKYDPFTGKIERKNYNMPRQAGTTLALCELGEYNSKVDKVVRKSLDFMARRARREGELEDAPEYVFFAKSAKAKRAHLGASALPLIAFGVCRERVGERFDTLMGATARALMAMQQRSGAFAPAWDRKAHAPIEGPEPLFAEGQVVFALSVMEKIQREGGAVPGWPSVDELSASVELAMDHYAGPYWDHALSQFFWIEENWHCLAARASLGHHRHDGYERMCLDYVRYKGRLSLDEDSRVTSDFVGGYGFGNVIAPHNTGTAGYGEALAAAISIARARGLDSSAFEADLLAAHTFLLRQQWGPANDFAVQRSPRVRGGFSESMSSPVIRIDYVQHAMAALGHGARVLYAKPSEAP